MTYITKLREYNARIQELVRSINSFHSNERLFQAMIEEYHEKRLELDYLSRRWNQKYLPAQEKVKGLCAELYTAENQREAFRRTMKLETDRLSIMELECIVERMKYSTGAVINSSNPCEHSTLRSSHATIDTQESGVSNSTASIRSSPSITPFVTNLDGPIPVAQECFPDIKVGHCWSISHAENRLAELESEYLSTEHKRRSLGSRTCTLSAKLQAIDREISCLKDKMLVPPEALYEPFEDRVKGYKIEFYLEQILIRTPSQHSSQSLLSASDPCDSFDFDITLPPVEGRFFMDI